MPQAPSVLSSVPAGIDILTTLDVGRLRATLSFICEKPASRSQRTGFGPKTADASANQIK